MTRAATLLGALLVFLIDAQSGASAQRREYRWCLRDTTAQTHICAYNSFRQCMASRNSNSDHCIPNPRRRR
jgi:hypothetical protein